MRLTAILRRTATPTQPTQAPPVVFTPGPEPVDIPPAPAFRDAWSDDPDRTARRNH